LKADNTSVAPRLRGLVTKIFVHDNQSVTAGAPLVRIDSEEFDARVASAAADFLSAGAGIDAAKAALASLDAEEKLVAASVRAAASAIQSADAQNKKASRTRIDTIGWLRRVQPPSVMPINIVPRP
jgi:membrane fusion protein (multidrug efflux system)